MGLLYYVAYRLTSLASTLGTRPIQKIFLEISREPLEYIESSSKTYQILNTKSNSTQED